MTNPMTFSDALCEVRKAHRLLWSFYDRLKPACQSLMKEFEPATFYYSDHHSLGNSGRNPLNNSSLYNTFPLSNMPILYGYDKSRPEWHDNPKKGDYLLILSIVLDSAFRVYDFDEDKYELGIENKDFPTPEESETEVFLTTVFCNRDVHACNWWKDVYYADWDYDFSGPICFNVNDSEPQNKNTDFIAFSEKFDIEKDFASPQAIKQAAENYRSAITEKIPAMVWSG